MTAAVAPASKAQARVRAPYLQATWTDPVTGARGHLVIDTLIRGLAAGGLRMRPGCTVEEVADLARAMTLKDAIAYRPGDRHRPVGGGKGGVDFDPLDPRALEVLERFLVAMRPLLETCWATGEDLGVRQDDLDRIAKRLGLRSTAQAALRDAQDGPDAALERVAHGSALADRGIGLAELVGGYGVARASLAALRALGREPAGCTAVIQGFGSMGGASARYLADHDVRVVAIADADGLVHNPGGLDVEAMLAARDRHGRFDRAALGAGDELLSREAWSAIPCDVLVPAAVSYAIAADTAAKLPAAVVCEAANVATSPEAEAILAARGVPVVPDFIANLATNAWWWWLLAGDVELTVEATFAKVCTVTDGLVSEAFARTGPRVPLRLAAVEMAAECAAAAAAGDHGR